MDYPFTTDGCSGGLTYTWTVLLRQKPKWTGECVKHDRTYWQGGTVQQRRDADRKLLIAIIKKGYPIFAFLMWAAVRIFGHPLLPFSWRWGYGYKWPRGYD